MSCLLINGTILGDGYHRKKLTLLFENLSMIKRQISDSNFGKNPLTNDLEKLTDLYHQWILVISDTADFINLNFNIG